MMLFISGLTGVGKSTTLKALATLPSYTLLPNRRELTDQIIIPEILQDEGKDVKPIKDRLERFRITAEYRKRHPSGIVHALKTHLEMLGEGNYIFDNIRGLDECKATLKEFPNARVIFLDAPPLVRLERLLGRNDSFDHVNRKTETTDLLEQLQRIEGIYKTFNPQDILKLKTPLRNDSKILDAVHIILAEQKNYNADDAASYLKRVLNHQRLLYLDTSKTSIEAVTKLIETWL